MEVVLTLAEVSLYLHHSFLVEVSQLHGLEGKRCCHNCSLPVVAFVVIIAVRRRNNSLDVLPVVEGVEQASVRTVVNVMLVALGCGQGLELVRRM